jgi:hypothetical protein
MDGCEGGFPIEAVHVSPSPRSPAFRILDPGSCADEWHQGRAGPVDAQACTDLSKYITESPSSDLMASRSNCKVDRQEGHAPG